MTRVTRKAPKRVSALTRPTNVAPPVASAAMPGNAADRRLVAGFPDAVDEAKAQALADLALHPSANAAVVLSEYTKALGDQDVGALMDGVRRGAEAVQTGSLERAEAMLFGQAHALQAIFMDLARRASRQQLLKQWEAYLRMALKAQNQCRMTLETLATIKNPPVVIARQANINNGGQQQVNQGVAPPPCAICAGAGAGAGAHAGEIALAPNELLEVSDGERLDTSTSGKASQAHPHMAAVGAIDRPPKR